jgi:hypothetical protein
MRFLKNHICILLILTLFSIYGSATLPNAEFNIPLFFDIKDNDVKLAPMTTEWDLSSQTKLFIANIELSENTFNFEIKRLKDIVSLPIALNRVPLTNEEKKEWVLILRWPQALIAEGVLEVLDRAGKVLWLREIKKTEIDNWKNTISQIDFGIRQIDHEKQPFWTVEEPFKFCLSHEEGSNFRTRICTSYYQVSMEENSKDHNIFLDKIPFNEVQARVILSGEKQKLKYEKEVQLGKPLQFFAELSSGSTFEYYAVPVRFNLIELVETEKLKGQHEQIKLMAWGPKPNIPVKEYKLSKNGILEKILGKSWSQTIGDMREYWEVRIPKSNPILYVAGTGGGLFKVKFIFEKLPSEKIRPYLSSHISDSTYSDLPKLKIQSQDLTTLGTRSKSLLSDNNSKNTFVWEYSAIKMGMFNHSTVQVSDGKNIFNAHREIYRGFPGEFYGRVSGLVSSKGGAALANEVGIKYWFETIGGWQNYYLSKQRIGVAYRNFQTLTPLKFGSYDDIIKYDIADINYRLNPGVWGWDESWGIVLSSAKMTYNIFQSNLIGFGFFWGRSMPEWADDILNYIPFFRKPKWVFTEFAYYPLSQSYQIELNNIGTGFGNWVLNSSAKMMWSQQFYTEVSAGIRQVDFIQNINQGGIERQQIQFTSVFGSFGFGMNF